MFSKSTIGCFIATHGVAVAGGGGVCWAYQTTFQSTPNPIEFAKNKIRCIGSQKNTGPLEQSETIEYYTCDSIQTTLPPLNGIDHDFSHSSTEFEMNRTFRSNTVAYKDKNKLTKGTITPPTPTKEEKSFYYNGNYGKNNLYFLKSTINNNPNIESLKKRISNFLLERTLENSLIFHADNPSQSQPSQQNCEVYGVIKSLQHIKYGICNNTSLTPKKPPTHIKTFQPLNSNERGEIIFAYGGHTQEDTKEAFMLQWPNSHSINPFAFSHANIYFYNSGVLREHELKRLIRQATIYLMHIYPEYPQSQHYFYPIWTEPEDNTMLINGYQYYFSVLSQSYTNFKPNTNDCEEFYCEGTTSSREDVSVGYDQQENKVFVITSDNYIYINKSPDAPMKEKKDLAIKITSFLEGKQRFQTDFRYAFHDMTYVHFTPKISLKKCKKQIKKYCEGKLMMTDKGYVAGTDHYGQVLFAKENKDSKVVINLAGKTPQDLNTQLTTEIDDFIQNQHH